MEYSANPQETKIEYFRGIKAFFNAPNLGTNILLASIHFVIPIVGPIVIMGWCCEIMQRLARRHAQPIPKLDFADFTHYLGRGIIPFVVALAAQLIFMFLAYIVMFIGMFGFGLLMGTVGDSHSSGPVFPILYFLSLMLLFLAIIVPGMILSMSLQTFAELTEDFSSSFNFSFLKNYLKLTWKKSLISYLIYLPVSLGFAIVGMLACYFGMFPAMVVVTIGMLYVRWQIYAYYLSVGGAPLGVKAAVLLPSEQKNISAAPR